MKLVVGLGNPGAEYEWTRHNVGFEVLESLASRHGAEWRRKPDAELARWGQTAVLAKAQTFMNLSSPAVQRWRSLYQIEPAEEAVIEAAIAKAVEAVELFVTEGIVAAMNTYNRKDDTTEDN